MIQYSIKVTISNPKENYEEFGAIKERIIKEETFVDPNPIKARKNAFNWYLNFYDIFKMANENDTSKIVGIDDIFISLYEIDENTTTVKLELWFDNEESEIQLPYVNRIIYGNTTTKIEQIVNLGKELDYYKRKGLKYGKSKIINVNQIGKFEIISETPSIDPKLYQFFTSKKQF